MPEQYKELFRLIADDAELFHLAATIKRKTYDAMVAAGFTKEEALQIVVHGGDIVKMS